MQIDEKHEIERIVGKVLRQTSTTPYVGILMERGIRIWSAREKIGCNFMMLCHNIVTSVVRID